MDLSVGFLIVWVVVNGVTAVSYLALGIGALICAPHMLLALRLTTAFIALCGAGHVGMAIMPWLDEGARWWVVAVIFLPMAVVSAATAALWFDARDHVKDLLGRR